MMVSLPRPFVLSTPLWNTRDNRRRRYQRCLWAIVIIHDLFTHACI